VHDAGIVLADENVSGTAHVGGKLINLIEPAIQDRPGVFRIAQVRDKKIVGRGFGEFGKLEIHAADPVAFPLEPPDDMRPDKASSAAYKCRFHSAMPSPEPPAAPALRD